MSYDIFAAIAVIDSNADYEIGTNVDGDQIFGRWLSAVHPAVPTVQEMEEATTIYDNNLDIYESENPEAAAQQRNETMFRLALLSAPSFVVWADSLKPTTYTSLTQLAVANLWPQVQDLYDQLKAAIPPLEASAQEWQALANSLNIELTF